MFQGQVSARVKNVWSSREQEGFTGAVAMERSADEDVPRLHRDTSNDTILESLWLG